jgi:hypothetical protein
MILVLDNAESILDPQGTDAQEIYAVVEELSQFRQHLPLHHIPHLHRPPDCKTLDIPTLSMEAARDTFYRIYKTAANGPISQQHPGTTRLPSALDHLTRYRRTSQQVGHRPTDQGMGETANGVLHTQHNKSLAATIELSLASPMFQELGPDARDLLGVVAFFPQGINENNLDWLFPTISDRSKHLRQILHPFSDVSKQRIHHDAGTTPRLPLPQRSNVISTPLHNQGVLLPPIVG